MVGFIIWSPEKNTYLNIIIKKITIKIVKFRGVIVVKVRVLLNYHRMLLSFDNHINYSKITSYIYSVYFNALEKNTALNYVFYQTIFRICTR